MKLRTSVPLIAVAALAAAAPVASADMPDPQALVAFDLGGGEQDHNVASRHFDGTASSVSFGPKPGKFLRGPSGPRFSPDGKRLLVGGHHHLDRDAQSLWVTTLEGGFTKVPVKLGRGILRGWDWSPNGRKVVFSVVRGGVQNTGRLYTARLDGTKLHGLGKGQYPTWAQEGGRIVYERPGGVYVVRANGKQRERVAKTGRLPTASTISPDGGTVLYTRIVAASGTDTAARSEWHSVDVDSGEDTVIARHGGSITAPTYGAPKFTPDGSRLITTRFQPAFSGGPEEDYALVTLAPDGTDEQKAWTMGDTFEGRFVDLDLQP